MARRSGAGEQRQQQAGEAVRQRERQPAAEGEAEQPPGGRAGRLIVAAGQAEQAADDDGDDGGGRMAFGAVAGQRPWRRRAASSWRSVLSLAARRMPLPPSLGRPTDNWRTTRGQPPPPPRRAVPARPTDEGDTSRSTRGHSRTVARAPTGALRAGRSGRPTTGGDRRGRRLAGPTEIDGPAGRRRRWRRRACVSFRAGGLRRRGPPRHRPSAGRWARRWYNR